MANVTTTHLFSIDTFNTLAVEPLYRESKVLSSGLTRIDTDSTHAYLPVGSGGAATWRDELEDLGDAGIDAAELQVTPKKTGCGAGGVRGGQRGCSGGFHLGSAMASAAATAVDVAFFQGGVKAPAGLTGVTLAAVDAAPTTLDPYTDALTIVEAVGGTPTVIWMSPTTWGTLAKIKAATGSNQAVLVPQATPGAAPTRSIAGVPVVVTAGWPDSEAYVADAKRVVVVMRRDGKVEVDHSVKVLHDGVAVRLTLRIGFAVPYPLGTVVKIKDLP